MRLGIEIGGTKLQAGAGMGDGNIVALERRKVVPEAGAGGILEALGGMARALRGSLGVREFEAVGIGFGGPVEAESGVVLTSHQISGWDQFRLADWARESLGTERVAVANDADTAALGEARFGAGKGFSPLLYVTVGSGIGGGLVVDGEIYSGSGRGAVEVGHLRSWRAVCGEDREPPTVESVASGWGLQRRARGALGIAPDEPFSAEDVAALARSGDERVLRLLKVSTDTLAEALAHAVTLLAPRRVVLGGGVSLMGEALWFEPVRREVDRLVFPPYRGRFDIVPAALGERVVVLGALALAHGAMLV